MSKPGIFFALMFICLCVTLAGELLEPSRWTSISENGPTYDKYDWWYMKTIGGILAFVFFILFCFIGEE